MNLKEFQEMEASMRLKIEELECSLVHDRLERENAEAAVKTEEEAVKMAEAAVKMEEEASLANLSILKKEGDRNAGIRILRSALVRNLDREVLCAVRGWSNQTFIHSQSAREAREEVALAHLRQEKTAAAAENSNREGHRLMEELLASNSRLHNELSELQAEKDRFVQDLAASTTKVSTLKAEMEIRKSVEGRIEEISVEEVKVKFHHMSGNIGMLVATFLRLQARRIRGCLSAWAWYAAMNMVDASQLDFNISVKSMEEDLNRLRLEREAYSDENETLRTDLLDANQTRRATQVEYNEGQRVITRLEKRIGDMEEQLRSLGSLPPKMDPPPPTASTTAIPRWKLNPRLRKKAYS